MLIILLLPAPPLFPPLQLTEGYSQLGYGSIPAKPAGGWSEAAVTALSQALGCCYASASALLSLDYLTCELQAVKTAQHAAASAAATAAAAAAAEVKEIDSGAALQAELFSVCKLLSIPSSEESVKAHPEKAAAQMKAKVRGRGSGREEEELGVIEPQDP